MHRRYFFIGLASIALFMEQFDATVLFTSLVHISDYFHVDALDLKSAIIEYFIGLSIFISICSYLVHKYGEKNVFIFACLIFILASLACGFSTSTIELAVCRFMQGAGASLMSPAAIMMAYRSFSPQEVIKVSSLINIPAIVGAGLGPYLGGIISSHFYWGWIFFINVPIGLGLIILCLYVYKVSPLSHVADNSKFDTVGFLFATIALITGAVLIETLTSKTIGSLSYFIIFVLFVVSIIIYILHFRKNRDKSIIDLSLFSTESLKLGVIINIFARIGITGIAFLMPLYLQQELSMSPQTTGFVIAFVAMGAFVAKIYLTQFIVAYGYVKSLTVAAVILAVSIVSFCFININTYFMVIILFCFFHGIANSFQYTAMNSLVLKDIQQSRLRKAISMNTIFQQFSNAMGVSITAYILSELLTVNNALSPTAVYQVTFVILALSCVVPFFIIRSLKMRLSKY